MKRYLVIGFIFALILTGCNSSSNINTKDSVNLEDFEVTQTMDETTEGDFVFRLFTEKAEYQEGEDVKLYGEIEYIGENSEVTIHHSSSAILFPMEEKIRDYSIWFGVDDIGLATTLKKGEPYREDYQKSGGYSLDQDPQEYIDFIRDFVSRKGLPTGFYVVTASTDFFVEEEGNRNRYNLEAKVEFKVKE